MPDVWVHENPCWCGGRMTREETPQDHQGMQCRYSCESCGHEEIRD